MEKKTEWQAMAFAAASGAMIFTIIGFLALGWTPQSVAATQAKAAAAAALASELSSICVVQFNNDPKAEANLKSLSIQTTFGQGKYIQDGPWAIMPGSEKSLKGVSKACANKLLGVEET